MNTGVRWCECTLSFSYQQLFWVSLFLQYDILCALFVSFPMMSVIDEAFDFASRVHEGKSRMSGEPAITHPLAVMRTLEGEGFSENVLCAALLHDVLEDADYPLGVERELVLRFDGEVCFLVKALTKDASIGDKGERDQKYFSGLSAGIERHPALLFIKAADLLHNVSTLGELPIERQGPWLQELKTFYLQCFSGHFDVIPLRFRPFYHRLIGAIRDVLAEYELIGVV